MAESTSRESGTRLFAKTAARKDARRGKRVDAPPRPPEIEALLSLITRSMERWTRLYEDSLATLAQLREGLDKVGGMDFRQSDVLAAAAVQATLARAQGSGRAGARLRGEAAKVMWVKSREVVPGEELATAWGLTRQALGPAALRGDLFDIKVGNRVYYPSAFLELERDQVAQVCRALGRMTSSEKFVFWSRPHGALRGKIVAAALQSGTPLQRVVALATSWALERGVEHGVERGSAARA